jgi:hypothetical protein
VPVLCLGREVWYASASPGDNSAAPNNVSLDELQAARCDYLGMCDKVLSYMQPGPHKAIKAALVSLGWDWSAPGPHRGRRHNSRHHHGDPGHAE